MLGVGSVVSNLLTLALSANRAPAWMAALFLVYGGVAIATAVLVWSKSSWAPWAFASWAVLAMSTFLILWSQMEIGWKLLPAVLTLLALLVVVHRRIVGWCRVESRPPVGS